MTTTIGRIALTLALRCSQPGGGFTYSISDRVEATDGYAVSIYPEMEDRYEYRGWAVMAQDIDSFVRTHRALLSRPDHYLGAWHNPEDGLVYLDVTVVVATPEAAGGCRRPLPPVRPEGLLRLRRRRVGFRQQPVEERTS